MSMIWVPLQGPPGLQGAVGPVGDQGPQGAQGAQGSAGPAGTAYPLRLGGTDGYARLITDWNAEPARETGFYRSANGANAPPVLSGWHMGVSYVHQANAWVTQRAGDFTSSWPYTPFYERRCLAGVWTGWQWCNGP